MSRVVSKHVFDFKPLGQYDEATAALEAEMEQMMEAPEAKEMMDMYAALTIKDDPESDQAYIEMMRGFTDESMFAGNPAFQRGEDQCEETRLSVPTTHDGEYSVEVEVYTPKTLAAQKKRAAYIYAHGGGGVSLSAAMCRSPMKCTAVDMNVVAFNVDYRIAPETKSPNNIKDFYEVVKYVHAHADKLGVDPGKLVIGGDSGGGYICLGAMVLMAEAGQTDWVKLAVVGVPMTDDYCFSDPLAMTVEERKGAPDTRKWWKLIAADFEAQKSSPYLFPGKASEEILAKFPPTIIIECEFDMFITEATRLATRLRREGRLLELVVIPGSTHTSLFTPGSESGKKLEEVLTTISKEYVHSELKWA